MNMPRFFRYGPSHTGSWIGPALAVLVLVASGDAWAVADPDSAAVKAYQKQSGQQLTALKAALKPPAAKLADALSALLAAIQTDGFDGALIEALGPVFEAAYGGLEQAMQQAWGSNSNAGQGQMSLAVGVYDPDFEVPSVPAAFYAGSGGARDQFAAAMTRTVDQALATPRRSAAKAMAGARRQGVGLTVQFFSPAANSSAALGFNEGAVMRPNSLPVSVEYLASGSDLAAPDDGVILIGGHFDSDAGPLTVVRTRSSSATTTSVVETVTPTAQQMLDGHWSVVMAGGLDGLAEGNYLLTVRQSGIPVGTFTVGVP